VPDEAARVAGLQAGDYDVAAQLAISNDQYPILRDADGVVAEISEPAEWDVIYLNWKSPLMGNLAMREAVQAALDHKPILQSARGGDEFIRLDPGLMLLQTRWHTTAGQDRYDMHNPDLARQKLQEAGYDGEPIRFMTTQDYAFMYGCAIVAKQQLEAVGMTVDLQVSDWATVVERRAKPEEWDMFTSSHGFVPDPTQITFVGQMNQFPGWWSSESSLALAAELSAETEFEVRYPIWEQIQGNAYTEIPAIKIGDSSACTVRRDNVGGWVDQTERALMYWNLWLNS
jgi:peptide/nickel transport system substrate-binding protein